MTEIRNLDTGQPEPLDRRRQDALDRFYGAQPASDDDFLPTSQAERTDALLSDAVGPAAVQAKHDARAQADRAAADESALPDDMVMTDRGPRSRAWLIAEGERLIAETQRYRSIYPYPEGHVTQPPIDSIGHRARMGMLSPTTPEQDRMVKENLKTWGWIILWFFIIISVASLIVDAVYRNL